MITCKPTATARASANQPRLRAAPVLVIDFDDTLTRGDTVGVLIDAAISAQARNSDAPDERRAGLRALKESLVQGYVEAFQGVISRHLPEGALARAQGLDMEVASGFLDDMNDFEARMNTRVVESGILAGIQARHPPATPLHLISIPTIRRTGTPNQHADIARVGCRRRTSRRRRRTWSCGRTAGRRSGRRCSAAGPCTSSPSTGPPP